MATFPFLTPPSVPVTGDAFIEANAVRSVESVVELLQLHLDLKVNFTSAEVLRLNYEGNVHLSNGDADAAIACYDQALQLGDKLQEGVLLVMRGNALLQRAYSNRMRMKDVLQIAERVLPNIESLRVYLDLFSSLPILIRYRIVVMTLQRMSALFENLETSSSWADVRMDWPEADEGPPVTSGNELLSKATFLWSLYEHALMRALADLLSATLAMPGFSQAWRRAGDALGDLRQFNTAVEYYEVAAKIEPALHDAVLPAIEKLKLTQKILENAAVKGYDSDSVLALIDD